MKQNEFNQQLDNFIIGFMKAAGLTFVIAIAGFNEYIFYPTIIIGLVGGYQTMNIRKILKRSNINKVHGVVSVDRDKIVKQSNKILSDAMKGVIKSGNI